MEKIWLKNYPKGIPSEIEIDKYSSVGDLFERGCAKYKDLPAYSNMGTTLTFKQVDALSLQFASYLQNVIGLKKGDRIAIQMPNLLQFPIALFGALRAGLIVVNTNPLYTAREMRYQFKDSGAKAILIVENFASHLEEVLKDTDIEHVIITELGDMLKFPKNKIVNFVVKKIKKMVPPFHLPQAVNFCKALAEGAKHSFKKVDVRPEDVAFLQYTGGTTGVSKGAMLTHRNVVSNMEQIRTWMQPRLKEGEEIIITPLPLYHIFSLVVNCMAFLAYGGHNVLITNPKDIPGFIKELKKWKFTVLSGVNTLFNALLHHPNFNQVDFSTVKISVGGGMALQKAVVEKWFAATKTRLIEGYGLTEASPVVSCNPVDGTDQVGTIGLPVASTEIKLIDEDGKEVGLGEPGELCARGPQVMKGYWQRPDETEKVITKDGWLKTGDVAVMNPDGFAKIVDRKKDMILISGFNVYPNEVEDVIASHPKVLEVAAIGVPDEKSGEAVKVFIVKKDQSLTEREIHEYCHKELVNYKVPKYIEFKNELPKTNVGKILRRALREPTS